MITIQVAALAAIVSTSGLILAILGPIIKLHSRLDVMAYRQDAQNEMLKALRVQLDDLREQLMRPPKT